MYKKIVFFFLVLGMAAAWLSAQELTEINYQGRLEEKGRLVTGTKNVRFNIYSNATAASGEVTLWTSGTQKVDVVTGLFRYTLTGIDPEIFDGTPKYLEIWVENEILKTKTGTREKIVSVPSAMLANRAKKIKWSGVEDIPGDFGLKSKSIGNYHLMDSTITVVNMGRDSVGSYQIIDGTITTQDIAAGAVTNSRIAPGVDPAKLAAGYLPQNVIVSSVNVSAVGPGQVMPDSEYNIKVATAAYAENANQINKDSIGTYHIIDSTITTADLSDNSVTPAKVSAGSYEHIRAGTATVATMVAAADVLPGSLLPAVIASSININIAGPEQVKSFQYYNITVTTADYSAYSSTANYTMFVGSSNYSFTSSTANYSLSSLVSSTAAYSVSSSSASYAVLSGTASYAETSGPLGLNSVGTSHIIDSTITAADIADEAITNMKLSTGIAPGKIAAGMLPSNIIVSSIAVLSVGSEQVKNESIMDIKLSTGIAPGKIAAGMLPSNVVTSSIAVLSMGSEQVKDESITDIKLSSGIAPGKIAGGTLPLNVIISSIGITAVGPEQLKQGNTYVITVTTAQYAVLAEQMPESSIGNYHIINGTITTVDLSDNLITPVKVSTASYEHIRVGTATVAMNVAAADVLSGTLLPSVIASSAGANTIGYDQLLSSNLSLFKVTGGTMSINSGYLYIYNQNIAITGLNFRFGSAASQSTGKYSIAMGYNVNALNNYSLALGNSSEASGSNSLALGKLVKATNTNSFVIGAALNVGEELTNNTANSLIIGFSEFPTLFVDGSRVEVFGPITASTVTATVQMELPRRAAFHIPTQKGVLIYLNSSGSDEGVYVSTGTANPGDWRKINW